MSKSDWFKLSGLLKVFWQNFSYHSLKLLFNITGIITAKEPWVGVFHWSGGKNRDGVLLWVDIVTFNSDCTDQLPRLSFPKTAGGGAHTFPFVSQTLSSSSHIFLLESYRLSPTGAARRAAFRPELAPATPGRRPRRPRPRRSAPCPGARAHRRGRARPAGARTQLPPLPPLSSLRPSLPPGPPPLPSPPPPSP